MDMNTAAATLTANLNKLNSKDQTFAASLLQSYERNRVSEKQREWIVKLAERTTQAAAPVVELGDMSGLYAIFQTAKASGLKHPKIVAMSPVGEIKLSVAGENARVPGSINVAETGAFGEAKYYGRINLDGSFDGRDTPVELVSYLKEFAAKPAEMAALHGQQTGNCCFCSRTLLEEGSVEVGFGPICAKRFGLAHPQNDKPAKPAKAARDPRLSFIATFGKRSVWAA